MAFRPILVYIFTTQDEVGIMLIKSPLLWLIIHIASLSLCWYRSEGELKGERLAEDEFLASQQLRVMQNGTIKQTFTDIDHKQRLLRFIMPFEFITTSFGMYITHNTSEIQMIYWRDPTSNEIIVSGIVRKESGSTHPAWPIKISWIQRHEQPTLEKGFINSCVLVITFCLLSLLSRSRQCFYEYNRNHISKQTDVSLHLHEAFTTPKYNTYYCWIIPTLSIGCHLAITIPIVCLFPDYRQSLYSLLVFPCSYVVTYFNNGPQNGKTKSRQQFVPLIATFLILILATCEQVVSLPIAVLIVGGILLGHMVEWPVESLRSDIAYSYNVNIFSRNLPLLGGKINCMLTVVVIVCIILLRVGSNDDLLLFALKSESYYNMRFIFLALLFILTVVVVCVSWTLIAIHLSLKENFKWHEKVLFAPAAISIATFVSFCSVPEVYLIVPYTALFRAMGIAIVVFFSCYFITFVSCYFALISYVDVLYQHKGRDSTVSC